MSDETIEDNELELPPLPRGYFWRITTRNATVGIVRIMQDTKWLGLFPREVQVDYALWYVRDGRAGILGEAEKLFADNAWKLGVSSNLTRFNGDYGRG